MIPVKDQPVPPFHLQYNGIRLGEPADNQRTHYPRWDVDIDPVYSDDGQTVDELEVTFSFQTYVYGRSEVEEGQAMDTISRRLSEPNKTLIIDGVGFNGLSIRGDDAGAVNPPVPLKDSTQYGVKPSRISCKPFGPACYEIAGTFRFRISPCSAPSELLSLSYQVIWSFDNEGLGTRVIQGTAKASKPNHLDEIRDSLNFALIKAFDRTNQTFSESADRLSLSFNITDVEYESDIRPPGLTEYEFSMSVAPKTTAESMTSENLIVSISGRARTRPGIPKGQGLAIILSEVASKVAQLSAVSVTVRNKQGQNVTRRAMVMPIASRLNRPNTHGRDTEFLLALQVMIPGTSRNSYPNIPGMVHVESTDFDWSIYLNGAPNGYFGARTPTVGARSIDDVFGVHNVQTLDESRYQRNLENLNDPCASLQQKLGSKVLERTTSSRNGLEAEVAAGFGCYVSRQNSIFAYQARVRYRQDQYNSVHMKSRYGQEDFPEQSYDDGYKPLDQQDVREDEVIVEKMGLPGSTITVVGMMGRTHWKPFAPVYTRINGVRVKLIGKPEIEIKQVGTLFGCNVYVGHYYQQYRILGKLPDVAETKFDRAEVDVKQEPTPAQPVQEPPNDWWQNLDDTLEAVRRIQGNK